VVALYDENENRKIDKNRVGIPKEGWGMSLNPRPHGAAPSFYRARFRLPAGTRLQIPLNY
jgi:uncharacterized protein (DUF2141 family)